LRREAELLRGSTAGQEAHRGTVVEARRVARRDTAVRPERRLERGEAFEGRLGARRLVAGGEPPTLRRLDRDRYEVGVDLACRDRCGELLLAGERETVCTLLRQ